MNRSELANKTHNLGAALTPDNPIYKQWIFRYTFLELEKDLGEAGDITSEAVVEDMKCEYEIISNSDCVLCGAQEIKYFLSESDSSFKPRLGNIQVEFMKKDGDSVSKGEKIAVLKGNAKDILKVERTVLNLINRMGAVATLTRKFSDAVKTALGNFLITPTRKTLWGLLDKRAVYVGGGGTHRLGLHDAILIKDTHLKLPNVNIESALQKAYDYAKKNNIRFVEIEVENVEDGLRAGEKISEINDKKIPFVIMLDNMKPEDVSKFIAEAKAKKLYDYFLIEVSGGVNLKNVKDYAKAGPDIISVGALTKEAGMADFSMEAR